MATRTEQIFATRDRLDNPRPSNPSFHKLLRQEIATEQDFANALNNTGKPWATGEYTLNYSPGQTDYTINATDVGKILFVVRLTGNQWVPALPVPFTDLEELKYGNLWGLFYNYYNGWGAYNLSTTIEQMSFFRTGIVNQEYKVEIQPRPQETCTYIITYLIGPISNDDPLEATVALPEFATLGQVRNAMSLLNYSEWYDDFEKNRIKRADLSKGFEYELSIREPLFNEYKRSLVHPKIVLIDAWNAYS